MSIGVNKRKCPACGSKKTHENSKYFTCSYCGFLNKKPREKK